MEWKMIKLTYNSISSAERFVLGAAFHKLNTFHGPDYHCTGVSCQHASAVVRVCSDAQALTIHPAFLESCSHRCS